MVQALSLGTLTAASGNCGICGSIQASSRNFEVIRKTPVASGIDWRSSYLKRKPNMMRHRNLKVNAGWLFNKGGGDKELGASSERSEAANEDILIFFFQLDLATRVQYALNMEQYDIAQQLRNKLAEVEEEIARQQEAKRGPSSKSEAQEKALSIISLRADLQNAIEKENYVTAAGLRDQISKLEAESLAASAKALVYENALYSFRLGQKVRHKIFGYRAVICGMDPVCCESSSWKETAQVEKLALGSNQPFYQVLVNVHEDPDLLVAYGNEKSLQFAPLFKHMSIYLTIPLTFLEVAEENLVAPEQPDTGRFDHPYASFLFYGTDTAGDFIPIKQLREKFNRPRHEIPFDPPDDDNAK